MVGIKPTFYTYQRENVMKLINSLRRNDKITFREYKEEYKDDAPNVVMKMKKFFGKTVTFDGFCNSKKTIFRIKEDNGTYKWGIQWVDHKTHSVELPEDLFKL